MTRPAVRRRTRKPPEQRRAEILSTASALAGEEGLESLTLRRVADELGVYPGLVSHYFQSVDELVVAAFRHAVSTESDELYATVADEPTPLDRLRRLLDLLVSPERNGVSLLWLDAWSAFRHRPALAGEVTRLMAVDQQRLADLIRAGVDAGQFQAADPLASASRIYSVIDGLTVLAAVDLEFDAAAVRALVFTNAERELAVQPGALQPDIGPTGAGSGTVAAVP